MPFRRISNGELTLTATEADASNSESANSYIAGDATPEEVAALVYERYGVMLRRFAASMLNGNWDRAEDILQEAAIRAWLQAKKRPDADVRLYSWLKTVVHNLVIDEHRARRVRPHTVQITDEDAIFHAFDQADLVIDRIELMGALEKLSRPHREILQYVYFRDRSIVEVSTELAIPPGTVKSRTYHAIKALRAALATCD